MATHVEKRPASPVETDGRPIMRRDRTASASRAKRIPQDPQPVPQQRTRRLPTPQSQPRYPAGYFFG